MDNRPVTIERTSKRIKAAIALGWIGLGYSLFLLFSGNPSEGREGGGLFWLSILLIIGAKVSRWWNNG